MNSNSIRATMAWVVLCILVPSLVHARSVDVNKATVSFLATGPMGMKINGVTHALRVSEDGKTLQVEVHLTSLKTGIELRDKHMRDKYLEVGKYPIAKLEVPVSSIHVPSKPSKTQGKVFLHGKTKSESFSYTVSPDGKQVHVHGELKLNMKDFGIEVPTYLGVTVKPEVTVQVDFDAKS
ncbi:MAG: YceI family protein [Myxococcales bacterium]|nr:MAG: YceI family protein [Myxococcales bacterium]